MAWSVPLTAVANAAYTAAQHNAGVRDNFLTTFPALATTAGSMAVATGVNAIAERIPAGVTIGTSETTASTSYTDMTTVGPTNTATTGTKALVIVSAQLANNTATTPTYMSYAISGATTVAATDGSALAFYSATANMAVQASRVVMQGLTAGSNTFKGQYRVGAGTGTIGQRAVTVFPL